MFLCVLRFNNRSSIQFFLLSIVGLGVLFIDVEVQLLRIILALVLSFYFLFVPYCSLVFATFVGA